ncbi:MAG: sulfite exporter TauE/SafE family protein [Bacteroidota bacterium]
MFILGHIAAIIIGISLGLIGSGGSILTVPVLVYLIGMQPVDATGYSLFIVGLTALVGCVSHATKKGLNYRNAILFGIPSIAGVYISRGYIVPALPENIISIESFLITKNIFIMLLFSVLMVISSRSMIKSGKIAESESQEDIKKSTLLLMLDGMAVGIITGFVGVGGGFLIIPALVNFAKMPMKKAIGTSLFIIAINAFIGFGVQLKISSEIDWKFLFFFSLFSISGVFVGNYISKFISGQKLKPIFGWFILVMGIYIIVRELIFQK